MKPGDVVLSPLAQSDGTQKRRPALLLKKMPGFNDWLVCGISTQLHQCIAGFDEKIDDSHPDYRSSMLSKPSVIRLGFLSVIPSARIPGVIGSVSESTYKRLMKNLTQYLNR